MEEKKENNKNSFDYENKKIVEHNSSTYNNSTNNNSNYIGTYLSICCVILLIFMITFSLFSPKPFIQSLIQFEALRGLFQLLGFLFFSLTYRRGGSISRFDQGE
jgi:hypothetical protein